MIMQCLMNLLSFKIRNNQNIVKLYINPSYGGTQEHENNSNNLDESEFDVSIELRKDIHLAVVD